MEYVYPTSGVCSRKIYIKLENDIVKDVKFDGGCNGNTKGLAAMVCGLNVNEVIGKLKGIKCGNKPTSCPDQLAIALEQALKECNK